MTRSSADLRSVGGLGARELLGGTVRQLHPDVEVWEAMLRGWAAQQSSRGLAGSTLDARNRIVRQFQRYTNEFPWTWTPADIEEFTATLRGERHVSHATVRCYQNALRLFIDYDVDARSGWPQVCAERFGTSPVQICHEWNTVVHGRTPALPSPTVRWATLTGTLGTNAAWGELRVVASGIVISGERSSQARARERLVDRLVASGEAAAQRRLRLPVCPRRIGVVAGAGTAGGADFDRLLEASGHGWQVVRRAVPMAGAHAAEAVADGISALAECRPDGSHWPNPIRRTRSSSPVAVRSGSLVGAEASLPLAHGSALGRACP